MTTTDRDFRPAWVEPRGPLVLGRGGLPRFAYVAPDGEPLPLPGTVAGMVRTLAWRAGVRKPEDLLGIQVAGPWLVSPGQEGPVIRVPAPTDLTWTPDRRPDRAVLMNEADAGHMSWPDGIPPLRPLHLTTCTPSHGKYKTPDDAEWPSLWPLDTVIRWNLGEAIKWEDVELPCDAPLYRPERRIHVALDVDTGTARPGMLFTTPGVRYGEGVGIGFAVAGFAPETSWPNRSMPVRLGGKNRVALLHPEGPAFPGFDRDLYEEALAKHRSKAQRVGLRLQLITPACFATTPPHAEADGNREQPRASKDHEPETSWSRACFLPWFSNGAPRDAEAPAGMLRLVAICMPRTYETVSGWNLAERRPRHIRRLLPAGTVFYFELPDAETDEALLDWARYFWARPIDAGEVEGDAKESLAPPANDGYGLVISGFWWEER